MFSNKWEPEYATKSHATHVLTITPTCTQSIQRILSLKSDPTQIDHDFNIFEPHTISSKTTFIFVISRTISHGVARSIIRQYFSSTTYFFFKQPAIEKFSSKKFTTPKPSSALSSHSYYYLTLTTYSIIINITKQNYAIWNISPRQNQSTEVNSDKILCVHI